MTLTTCLGISIRPEAKPQSARHSGGTPRAERGVARHSVTGETSDSQQLSLYLTSRIGR